MQYSVNNTIIAYETTGEKAVGQEIVLVQHADDLTAGKSWSENGFTIDKLFDDALADIFQTNTVALLHDCWKKAGLVFEEGFSPDQYHTLVSDFHQHLAAVEYTKLIDTQEFPVPITLLEKRISEICNVPLKVLNPFDGQSVFHFRVVRPSSRDNNPLHRDVWLEDYDDCINLYIPIAASTPESSLILFPGSHLWPESRIERTVNGAVINNVKFNVPAVTSIHGAYTVERPDPKPGEVLVFSPYLIHGGAVNLQPDKTRISIEIRLWRQKVS